MSHENEKRSTGERVNVDYYYCRDCDAKVKLGSPHRCPRNPNRNAPGGSVTNYG